MITGTQKHYFAIVSKKNGRLVVTNSGLPIYWLKKVAQEEADKFYDCEVKKVAIQIDELKK